MLILCRQNVDDVDDDDAAAVVDPGRTYDF